MISAKFKFHLLLLVIFVSSSSSSVHIFSVLASPFLLITCPDASFPCHKLKNQTGRERNRFKRKEWNSGTDISVQRPTLDQVNEHKFQVKKSMTVHVSPDLLNRKKQGYKQMNQSK